MFLEIIIYWIVGKNLHITSFLNKFVTKFLGTFLLNSSGGRVGKYLCIVIDPLSNTLVPCYTAEIGRMQSLQRR